MYRLQFSALVFLTHRNGVTKEEVKAKFGNKGLERYL